MKKLITALTILALLTGTASAKTQNTETPFNPFTAMENFIENTEVQLAGIIGGPDLKAKALANNAEESLQEAEKLADRNRSEAATRKIQKYERNLNKSQNILDQGQNQELKDQVQNLSDQNIQRLEEVKKKVPKQAQKGIEKAINNSKNRGQPPTKEKTRGNNTGKPEKPLQNTPSNQPNKTGETIDKNISKPENKTGKNQTGVKPGKGENNTGKQQKLSREGKEISGEINDENGSNSDDTDGSVGKPVEDNASKPSLNR